jgi:hypothetical protein
MERLIHDCAWAHAQILMDLVGHVFREEEQRELFAAFYTSSRRALEAFLHQQERQHQRLRPSSN